MENKVRQAPRRRQLLGKMGTLQSQVYPRSHGVPLRRTLFVRYMINCISRSSRESYSKQRSIYRLRYASQVKRSNSHSLTIQQTTAPNTPQTQSSSLPFDYRHPYEVVPSSPYLFEALFGRLQARLKQRIEWLSFIRSRFAYFWPRNRRQRQQRISSQLQNLHLKRMTSQFETLKQRSGCFN